MKIGIFGGTFDPPHIGHLIIAETAREALSLDKVILIPVYIPPHKSRKTGAGPAHRLAMAKLAARGNPLFKVSDIEVKRKGISYTVDTLRNLRRNNPKAEFVLIVGSDNYQDFESWKSPAEILRSASIAVYRRRGHSNGRSRKNVRYLGGPLLEIASSDIRKRVARRESILYLVPHIVGQYIVKHRLYLH